jgi:hypothetical protein
MHQLKVKLASEISGVNEPLYWLNVFIIVIEICGSSYCLLIDFSPGLIHNIQKYL